MSGAPIIQNNKFVGAVTHVLVNDPTVGYGVFADIMIKEVEKTKNERSRNMEKEQTLIHI